MISSTISGKYGRAKIARATGEQIKVNVMPSTKQEVMETNGREIISCKISALKEGHQSKVGIEIIIQISIRTRDMKILRISNARL